MTGSREQLLETIRKLRRLAGDVAGTPEGAAATRKIRELMRRHGITAADVKPPARPATKKPSPVARSSSPSTSAPSTPATITLKIGNVRIRWKL